MSGQIYLDHAATTEMLPEVREAMKPYLSEKYGNPSTGYGAGKEAKEALDRARTKIAYCLDARPEEIFFTSGGTESDNWAVKGTAARFQPDGTRIITSRIEHHAVLNSCLYLQEFGYEVVYLDTDDYGSISFEELEKALTDHTVLVSIMYANNEIGTLQPVREIANLVKSRGILFHTDAVQAVGQIPVSVLREGVDLLSASAHKFHGPKGIGFLYIRTGVEIPSYLHGGGQENGKRAGTENVASIVGMAEALEISVREMRHRRQRETALRNYFMEKIQREIPEVKFNGHPYRRLPGNISVSFRNVDATSLLTMLSEEGIAAASGSACTTGTTSISHVITAIHLPEEFAKGTIRFSLGRENTRADIDRTMKILNKSVRLLRGE